MRWLGHERPGEHCHLSALLVAFTKEEYPKAGASSREEFSGFPIRSYTNQPAEIQRLARMWKLCMKQVNISSFSKSEQQRFRSDCAEAQSDLRLGCSQAQ